MKHGKKEDYLYSVRVKKSIKLMPLSDVHFDSPKCDRKLLKKHLEQAVKEDAYIWLNGDWLDVMGCSRDPRSAKGDIRPEYDVINYLDAVIDDSVKFLKPYADRILFVANGNHETNILKRQETDVLDRMVYMLNKETGSNISRMGYSGWLRVNLERANSSRMMSSVNIHFHHGFGGNAQRSKGVLRVDLDHAHYPDADIIVRGHDHQKWAVPKTSWKLTVKGKQRKTKKLHLALGSYKDGLKDNLYGWEVEKGFTPTTLGSWIIELTGCGNGNDRSCNLFDIKYTELS